MKEAKKSKRRRRERWGNRFALLGITFVVGSLALVVNTRSAALEEKNLEYQVKEDNLRIQIAQEQERASRLKEENRSVEDYPYIEKIAKEKLGLVNPDEILLKPIQ